MDPITHSLHTSSDPQSLSLSLTVPLTPPYICPILSCLFNLSKYSNQTLFIDNLINRMNHDLHPHFLTEINKMWPSIPYNRKDKFYYFIQKLYTDKLKVLDTDLNSEIKQFIVKKSLVDASLKEKIELIKRIENMKDAGCVKVICDGLKSDGLREEIKKVMRKIKCDWKRRQLGRLYKRKS